MEQKHATVTYSQDWVAYDKAQTNEKLLFLNLLNDLCSNVEQPTYKFGRPTLPHADMVFSSVLKVYSTFSLRRFLSDVKLSTEWGFLSKAPCFASVGHFMQREDITPLLERLIRLSSLPLKNVEQDFAVDSSGFATSRFARWFDHKWGKEQKHRIWLKAHLMSGVKTNIVTSCSITEKTVHDTRAMPKLLKETAEQFNLREVSADRAYQSRELFNMIEDVGAIPFIPFKKNATGKCRGSIIWKRMFHLFMFKNEEFMQHYHKRSNSETVFHMIKSKFGMNLRSKTRTAQINELLCKILAHNICVVIQEMMELGIDAKLNSNQLTD
jgi:transposase